MKKRVTNTEEFKEKGNYVHKGKYIYLLSEYVDSKTKLLIICPKHGKFWQKPNDHLNGKGCKVCYNERRGETQRSNKSDFIEKANNIHNNKYDYSKVKYINTHTKVCIMCPDHGEFWIEPSSHLAGKRCKECAKLSRTKKKTMTNEEFIHKSKTVHGEEYDYSFTKYDGIYKTVEIGCPIHGIFKQIASYHLSGNGCPKCKRSRLEEEIEQFLIKKNIEFITQYKQQWLGLQSLDFYLPKYNVGIECQGGQHFSPFKFYGGEEGFNKRKILDENKFNRCKEHGIKVIYYSNLGIEYPYEVFEDKDKMLQEIINGDK